MNIKKIVCGFTLILSFNVAVPVHAMRHSKDGEANADVYARKPNNYSVSSLPLTIGAVVTTVAVSCFIRSIIRSIGFNLKKEQQKLELFQKNKLFTHSFVHNAQALTDYVIETYAYPSFKGGLIKLKTALHKDIEQLTKNIEALEKLQQKAANDVEFKVECDYAKAQALMMLGTALANSNYINELLS